MDLRRIGCGSVDSGFEAGPENGGYDRPDDGDAQNSTQLSLTTLLIELAIEACWGATEDIDVVVAGAMTNPIPAPTSAMIAARIPNGAYLSAAIDRTNSPADMTARPVAIELRTPNRPTIRSLLEATVAITSRKRNCTDAGDQWTVTTN